MPGRCLPQPMQTTGFGRTIDGRCRVIICLPGFRLGFRPASVFNPGFGFRPGRRGFGLKPGFGVLLNPGFGFRPLLGLSGFFPGRRVPGLSVPGFLVPGLSVPGLLVPGNRFPGLNEPGLNEPGFVVPGLKEPGFGRRVDPLPGTFEPKFGRVEGLSVEPLPNFDGLVREPPVNRELLPRRELLLPNCDGLLPVRLDEPNRFEPPNERFMDDPDRFIELPPLRPNELRELLLRLNELPRFELLRDEPPRDELLRDEPPREEPPPRRD